MTTYVQQRIVQSWLRRRGWRRASYKAAPGGWSRHAPPQASAPPGAGSVPRARAGPPPASPARSTPQPRICRAVSRVWQGRRSDGCSRLPGGSGVTHRRDAQPRLPRLLHLAAAARLFLADRAARGAPGTAPLPRQTDKRCDRSSPPRAARRCWTASRWSARSFAACRRRRTRPAPRCRTCWGALCAALRPPPSRRRGSCYRRASEEARRLSARDGETGASVAAALQTGKELARACRGAPLSAHSAQAVSYALTLLNPELAGMFPQPAEAAARGGALQLVRPLSLFSEPASRPPAGRAGRQRRQPSGRRRLA